MGEKGRKGIRTKLIREDHGRSKRQEEQRPPDSSNTLRHKTKVHGSNQEYKRVPREVGAFRRHASAKQKTKKKAIKTAL